MLDDQQDMQQRDSQGMLRILGSFDQQLDQALALGRSISLDFSPEAVGSIVFSGMGGSAMAGDLIRAYIGPELKVPFLVNRNYRSPGFLGPSTLVLLSSYSGNTEETLSVFHEAVQARAGIICLSSNGELKRLAQERAVPFIEIPPGFPPRAALGYTTMPFLAVLARLGLISDRREEVRRSCRWVRRRIEAYGPETLLPENAAKSLALHLQRRIPIIYGSQDRLDVVAARWKGQISENAKQLAFSASLPEMNHNEIVGWKNPGPLIGELLPIFLRDREDHSRVQIRAEITREMLGERTGSALEYWSDGESWLERLMTLILLGDYASVYLAFLNQESPTPVEPIEMLKNRLREYP